MLTEDRDSTKARASLNAEPYARLSQQMLQRLARYGEEVEAVSYEVLFQRGERSVDLLVVLNGKIELRGSRAHSKGVPIARLTKGQFTGELDFLSVAGEIGGATLVAERACKPLPYPQGSAKRESQV